MYPAPIRTVFDGYLFTATTSVGNALGSHTANKRSGVLIANLHATDDMWYRLSMAASPPTISATQRTGRIKPGDMLPLEIAEGINVYVVSSTLNSLNGFIQEFQQ